MAENVPQCSLLTPFSSQDGLDVLNKAADLKATPLAHCFVKSGSCLSILALEKKCVHTTNTTKILKPNVFNGPRK